MDGKTGNKVNMDGHVCVNISTTGEKYYTAYSIPIKREPNWIEKCQTIFMKYFRRYTPYISKVTIAALLIGYIIYLGFAINHNFDKSVSLIVLTSLTVSALLYIALRDNYGDSIDQEIIQPSIRVIKNYWPCLQW